MAEGRCEFPVLVKGDCKAETFKTLKNKLQLYFQSLKLSGGGECIVEYGEPSKAQAVVCFASEEGKCIVVLLFNLHMFEMQITICVSSGATAFEDIKSDDPYHPSAVVLNNLSENVTTDLLILFVENNSRLSEGEGDFTLEMLSDIDAAVVIFKKTIDIFEFIAKCSGKVIERKKIVAKHLEITRSILVENLSPAVSDELLKLYFEKPIYGGAVVNDIVLEDSSAIISFQNAKDLDSILDKDHVVDKKPILVYPYYKSLASALYGNKGPVVKMPDAFPVTVNPYILNFLRDKRYIGEINDKMSKCYCDVVWPDLGKPNIIKLLPSFSKVVKGLTKLTKVWKKEALDTITSILLKYTFAENNISLPVWKAVQPEIDQLSNQNVSVVLDMPLGKVILVGEYNPVNELKQQMRNIIEIAFRKQERENQSISQTIDLSPAMYTFLQHNDLQENLSIRFADLWMNYDATTGSLILCGLQHEVHGGKSYVLQELINLKQKQIEMDNLLICFLQMVKNNESCHRIFTSLGINAVYEIKDNGLVLYGKENNILFEAERSLETIFNIKQIVVENRDLIAKREWKQLLKELDKKLNYSQKIFEIEEMPFGTGVRIAIFGFSDAVNQVFEHLDDFVNKNAFIKKFIEVESSAMLGFLVHFQKITSLPHTEKKDVKIEVNENQMNIKLSGPREHVCDVEDFIRKEISLLSFSVLNLTEPGIKIYFKEEKDILAASVMQKFHCVIKSQEKHFLKSDNKESSQLCYQVQLPDGPLVAVLRGDLCGHHVDVIVNAANENLQHIGGLAGAVLKAAGPMLQTTCDYIIKTQGILKPGDAVITDAGNLPCSSVIHTVGPRWGSNNKETSVKSLKRAVKESLRLAEMYNLRSIAIPAISSGIFGFPLKLCAEIIVQSIKEFWKDSKGRLSLQKIDLLNNDRKTVEAVLDAVQREFDVYIKTPSMGQSKTELRVQETGNVNQEKALTKKDPNVQIVTSCIQNMKVSYLCHIDITDVIVTSVGPDLCLKKGAISFAIYNKAGPMLQQLLMKEANGNVPEGDIIITKGCNLNCDVVFHVIVPKWDKGTGNASEILKHIISSCLQNAEALQLKSISFPAIGTGLLGFPKSHVANIMFEEVSKFTSVYHPKFLQDIYFVLHPNDEQTIAVSIFFLGNIVKISLKTHLITNFSTVIKNVSKYLAEMKVGEILLQVVLGDITKETTDIIVNSTASFEMKTGRIEFFDEVMERVDKGSAVDEIITKGGSLLCKNTIHLIAQEEPEKTKSGVVKALHICETNRIPSITFSTIGTGLISYLFLKNLFLILLLDRLTSFIFGNKIKENKRKRELIILADLIEPAIIHICGESEQEVKNAESWLKELALNQLDGQVITNDLLYGFGKREHEELRCLQKQLQVKIEFEYKQSVVEIRVCGLKRNVSSAGFKIHQMMEDVRKEQERINDEELISHMVQWQFKDGNQFMPFDNATNFKLENAFIMKENSVVIEIHSKTVTVDFNNNTAEDINHKKFAVKQDSYYNWCYNYDYICSEFIFSAQIKRIQNLSLWKKYLLEKKTISEKNALGNKNERILFHKPTRQSVEMISTRGFDRNFTELPASSIHDTYSSIKANRAIHRLKYMFRARVITGEFCQGVNNMIVPPVKNTSYPTDLYDSVVDNPLVPSLFVIFKDIQAYPEYFIEYY
uniref:Poly [ADP-ribose] polymerase 14-like n=1 Tax=Callorhinchus milii TaxID=7868 RepID=A0A4W3JVW2_CALMI